MNKTSEELINLRQFHGHLGPYVILGCLMGEYALNNLSCSKYFGLNILVKSPPFPPESCLLDGLQFSTGCTLGKGNIKLIPADETKVVFITDSKKLGCKLNTNTLRKIPELLNRNEKDIIGGIFKIPQEELFESFKPEDF